MNKVQSTIHGLDQLKQAEYKTARYYLSAATAASEHDQQEKADTYLDLQKSHGAVAVDLEGRKEALEKANGEGLIEELFENVVDALKAFVADLPTLFVQAETNPSPKILIGLENELIGKYRKLNEIADEETRGILESVISVCERHIEQLEAIA